jgi:hypothetical protein
MSRESCVNELKSGHKGGTGWPQAGNRAFEKTVVQRKKNRKPYDLRQTAVLQENGVTSIRMSANLLPTRRRQEAGIPLR